MGSSGEAVLCTAREFLDTHFDYLIVGGGTAGLVLAARLTEDASVNVGVLEAGQSKIGDPLILTPLLFTKLAGNPEYDWMMKTVPQAGTKDKMHAVPRGKVLGGSSAINFMIYVRGHSAEYDDWVKLGAKGWSWADLEPYFRKHEGMYQPTGNSTLKPEPRYDIKYHGLEGPIKTSFANWHSQVEEDWHQAVQNTVLGPDWREPSDAWSGDHLGAHTNLSTIDRSSGPGTRSYSVTGYLEQAKARKNLKIIINANVDRIILENIEGSDTPQATDVVFSIGNEQHTARAKREILLCAGAIKTPQVLELSGIGNRALLEEAGITCLVENNMVGENLQDHLMTCMVYDLADNQTSLDILANPEALQAAVGQYQAGKGGPLANGVDALCYFPLTRVATKAEIEILRKTHSASTADTDSSSQEMRKILTGRLEDSKVASLQLSFLGASLDPSRLDDQAAFLAAPAPGQSRVTVGVTVCHPFSQGSVHIASKDPVEAPRIDPAYLKDSTDLETTSIGLRIADEIFRAAPLAQGIKQRVFPAADIDFAHSEARADYIRSSAGTQYHPIGTAAIGSVVDSSLRVIGTNRLRVVDASVFPMHVSGNIQATVYAIAEKAADIIKGASY